MLITFEGIDYSGKTTQAKLVADRLTVLGRSVKFLREPGGTDLSEKIRSLLLQKSGTAVDPIAELLLFSAARAQLVHEIIQPALREGMVVVCDRFYDSTTAYQGFGRKLPLAEVKMLNRLATHGTIPDLTLFVDVDLDQVKVRREKAGVAPDRMELSGDHFFDLVRAGYKRIAGEEPGRVVVIDGMKSIDEIHNIIWTQVQKRLK